MNYKHKILWWIAEQATNDCTWSYLVYEKSREERDKEYPHITLPRGVLTQKELDTLWWFEPIQEEDRIDQMIKDLKQQNKIASIKITDWDTIEVPGFIDTRYIRKAIEKHIPQTKITIEEICTIAPISTAKEGLIRSNIIALLKAKWLLAKQNHQTGAVS